MPTPSSAEHTDLTLSAPVRKVDALLDHYGLSHTHPTNELIHFIAIPAIMLSLVGMMFAAHPAIAVLFLRPAWSITPACPGGSRHACFWCPR